MKIDINVNISDNNILSGLREVLNVIDKITKTSDVNIIDFKNNRFVSPIFILPLLVYVKGSGRLIDFVNLGSYLKTIKLDVGGLRSEDISGEYFEDYMNKFKHKTFLPIINFSAEQRHYRERNLILSSLENILKSQLRLESNITIGLKYIIQESIDNIIEHSESNRGYILCQAYPNKKFLDICIADNGITLLGSYVKSGFTGITDDLTAITKANKGISTKKST